MVDRRAAPARRRLPQLAALCRDIAAPCRPRSPKCRWRQMRETEHAPADPVRSAIDRGSARRRRGDARALGDRLPRLERSHLSCFPSRATSPRSSAATGPALLGALGITLTRRAAGLRRRHRHRHADRVPVRAEPGDREELLSLCGAAAGDADRGDRAADHHPGEEHAGGVDRLRDRRGAVPDHLQYHARPAQRRSRPGQPVPHEQGGPAADAAATSHSERAALLLRRLADFERSRADRRGRGRVRRRHRRPQLRASPTKSSSPASSSTSRACSRRCCSSRSRASACSR